MLYDFLRYGHNTDARYGTNWYNMKMENGAQLIRRNIPDAKV
jgi:hypothetical protein